MKKITALFGMFFIVFISIGYAGTDAVPRKVGPTENYALHLCQNPEFKCVKIRPGDMWYRKFRNKNERELVMRLNRTNVALKYLKWIVVPRKMYKANYMDLSPFPHQIKPQKKELVFIDLSKFAFAAYDPEGKLVWWGPAVGGKDWCEDLGRSCKSASGVFKIYRKQGKDCTSSRYPIESKGGAKMPYCMHYYKGFAIHGSTMAGFMNRSRGCIRLFDDDARWLNQEFANVGTKIIVCRKDRECNYVEVDNNHG